MDEQPKLTGIRVSRAMMEHTARAEEFANKALQHQEGVRKNQKLMREEFQAERRRAGQRLTQLEAQVAVLTDSYALLRAALDQLLRAAPTVPAPVEDAPLLPAPDALMSDWGQVGVNEITGDMLLDAFEADESETTSVVQTLSAKRQKHLSEQLNVERARLDREHQATGVTNPRSASIDRLLGLLTRRGEV